MASSSAHSSAVERGTIEVKVRNLNSLFNSLDPSPFAERDLGREAEEFIVGWALEYPRSARLKLIVHVMESSHALNASELVQEGVQNYFDYRSGMILRDLHETLRQGRRALLVGLFFLIMCLLLSNWMSTLGEHSALMILGESLVIAGWVAMWGPMEIILYGWWPISRRLRLYRRLSDMKVELKEPVQIHDIWPQPLAPETRALAV